MWPKVVYVSREAFLRICRNAKRHNDVPMKAPGWYRVTDSYELVGPFPTRQEALK